ncbi:MAG: hypothetical protein P1U87_00270 [Verrucomicrobiales bacterium]|nr:hypothetical protein [Verrucomicrobiales bacterium]
MKGFLTTLVVVCLVIGGLWYAYEPYIKPLLNQGPSMAGDDSLISNESGNSPAPSSSAAGNKPKAPAASSKTASSGGSKASPKAKPAPEKKSELDLLLEEKYPMPEIIPLLEIVDNWNNVPQRAFPPEVFANETVAFQLVVNGQAIGSSNVAPGTPLTPIRLNAGQLQVGNKANPGMNTVLPVEKTDFKQRIEKRYNDYVVKVKTDVTTKRAQIKKVVEANPAKLAVLKGESAPAVAASDGGDPKFGPVKSSLSKGEAASVTLEEATSFTWNGSEKITGEYSGTYDTVTVHFEVKTIFGKFPVNYKALLQGGRVVGWIDPITEERI